MFSTLPDFTPRDSHSLWYSSSRNPIPPPGPVDNLRADPSSGHHGPAHSRQRGQLLERTLLARLASDEQKLQRRRMNVQNFGSTWLKPPGVPKTLHQMREEKREQEEHQEAMRREQLAQELAEAEGGAMDDGMMDDVQLDGAQDLDDEIPDADDGFDPSSDDSEEDEDEEDDDGDDYGDGGDDGDENRDDGDDDEEAVREEEADEEALREERQHDLVAARMRMADDAFREALIRGDLEEDGSMYGGEEELEDEDRGQILDEEDFARDGNPVAGGMAGDMNANLDDDIPEAEDGGYEHTDSEDEVSSSAQGENHEDDEEEGEGDTTDTHDLGFAPSRAAPLGTPQSPTLPRHAGFHNGPRASIDLSGLLSQDESSLMMMESSPAVMRRRPGQRK
ncbi:anaphase-promoting complex [Trichoderma cornu-damae]|uniref:Anaphase-promoting complex n=1 Tax=Trichoderma cornu-damae TaxID=654480 RepID=A0A9P8QMY3_9HYPO|nr:anaphase-promoting complex [Trichoderma cornu-damae]